VHGTREVGAERLERTELFIAQEAFVCMAVPRFLCREDTRGLWCAPPPSTARRDQTIRVRDNIRSIEADDIVVDGLARDTGGTRPGLSMQNERRDGNKGFVAVATWTGNRARTVDRGREVMVEVRLGVKETTAGLAIIVAILFVDLRLFVCSKDLTIQQASSDDACKR